MNILKTYLFFKTLWRFSSNQAFKVKRTTLLQQSTSTVTMAYVKSEHIKSENDAAGSPASFAESEAFEDAGDLEFRDDQRFSGVYLARVPKYVWEQWENLGDDEEIVLGTLRQSWVERPDGGRGQETVGTAIWLS